MIKVDVKIVDAIDPSMWVINFTNVWDKSNVVCLQENATVKLKVIIIKDLSCVLNSSLNFFDLWKKRNIANLIYYGNTSWFINFYLIYPP